MKRVNGIANERRPLIGNKMKTEKKNWNLFAGDLEYRSNFALEFGSPYTFERFKQEKFQRLLFPIKGYILVSLVFWFLAYWVFQSIGFISFHAGIAFHIAAFYFTKAKRSPLHVRLCFVFVEYMLQAATFTYAKNYFLLLHLTLFNIPTFILGTNFFF